MWAVTLRMKCFGGYTLRPEGPELSTQYHALFEDAAHEEKFKRSNIIVPSAENLATVINKMNIDSRRNLYNSLVAEVFEKVNIFCLTYYK